MKSLIIPLAVITGLIVCFYMIFNRYDNAVRNVQTNAPAANGKTSANNSEMIPIVRTSAEGVKLIENKQPTDNTPRAETKPTVSPAPVTETPPVTEAPVVTEATPITEAKQVVEDKSAPVPTAVPVVSPEEAERLNDFALFLATVSPTVVEGEIIERTDLPDLEEIDYPNCRFTAHFMGNAIKSGEPCPQEMLLIFEGINDYKILETNLLKKGDKIQISVVPFDVLPEEYQTTQQADDLNLFSLESFYVSRVWTINHYTKTGLSVSIPFSETNEEYISVFERHLNPPIPRNIQEMNNNRIKKDLEEALRMLSSYEEKKDGIERDFQIAWDKEKEKFPDGFNRIGKNIWRNINHSFWYLPADYNIVPTTLHTISKNKMDSLIALNDFLKANGIHLIVSLIPQHYDISSRVIIHDFCNTPVYQMASYTKQLSEAGIECPYMATSILKNYNKFPFAYMFPIDEHPGSTVQFAVSEVLSERLKEYSFPQNLDPGKFEHVQVLTYVDAEKPVHLYPSNCDIDGHKAGTCYTSDQINYEGKPILPDPKSEILIIGNSSIQFPMGPSQDSFQAFLAERLCYSVSNYRVNAHGPFTTIIQSFFDNPSRYLEGKKVIILQTLAKLLLDETTPWKNIREMDEYKKLLNGKKLVARTLIQGNGNWGNDIRNENIKKSWIEFGDKQEIKCLTDERTVIYQNTIEQLDPAKPILCIIQTVRSSLYNTPQCIVNGISKPIPAGFYYSSLAWQDIYFSIPAGTKDIQIEVQGEKDSLIGFNQVFFYQ